MSNIPKSWDIYQPLNQIAILRAWIDLHNAWSSAGPGTGKHQRTARVDGLVLSQAAHRSCRRGTGKATRYATGIGFTLW